MCNLYEPATPEWLDQEFADYKREANPPYKRMIGPRDQGPFVVPGRVRIGQWGMIRPGSPERLATDSRGRPLMTNNARTERMASAPTYREAWKNGQRCLIPAASFDEPYWGTGKNIWWRFRRSDRAAWMLAGLWSDWADRATGEIVPSYTMLTMNCDAHPLLRLMHKPETDREGNLLPADQQDKRTVVPIERENWQRWLTGSIDDALSLIRLPLLGVFAHGAADPAKQVELQMVV